MKAITSDRQQLNKQWDELMNDVHQVSLDVKKAVYLMERLNCLDKFLLDQGVKLNA